MPQLHEQNSNSSESKPTKRFVLENEVSYFGLASALDFFMTFILLSLDNFRESNQIANSIFQSFGTPGLAIFKVIMVVAVVCIAIFVERRRKNAGRFLLICGTIVVGSVVVYSASLYFKYSGFF